MSFFKAYDMRGTYGVDFDSDLVRKIGFCLPKVIPGKRWLVGRDVRVSSPEVHDALVSGLTAAGVEVTDLGLSTTSMVYFFTGEDDFDASVMVTASHNPPSDNGLKVSKKTALPVGYVDGLNKVEAMIDGCGRGSSSSGASASFAAQTCASRALAVGFAVASRPSLRFASAHLARTSSSSASSGTSTEYHKRYLEYFKTILSTPTPSLYTSLSNLRFAVDCSNGMSALFARELFPNAVIINETLDGTFPAHSPNPLKAEARAQISALVREKGLDCGVIFDGDADRAMFVDEKGDFVQPDYLIPLIAKPGEKTIHDVRTSRGAIETLREMGCEPVMVPVGAALAKPILRKIGAFSGGELAGHYYFSEFHGCDSGLLAAIRILQKIAAAKAAGKTFLELVKPIVSRYANSGELNYKVEDKDGAIARVLETAKTLAPETGRSEIDGIRLEYADGWISIRKSNTEPYLRLLVEHRESAVLKQWIQKLESSIVHLDLQP